MAPRRWDERSRILLSILKSQRTILKAMGSSAQDDDLTLQQFAVMGVVVREGPVAMSRLSDELRVSRPNMTGVVDRLEKKGLVSRAPGAHDRRKKEIHLTERGDILYRRVRKDYSAAMQKSLDALTVEEQETLARLLGKFAKGIDPAEVQRKKETDG